MAGLNIQGLATGLDTASIITATLTPDTTAIGKLTTKQTVAKQRQSAFVVLKSQLENFQSKVSNLLLASSMNTKSATVTNADGTSNSTLGVTAGADSLTGSFSVTVDQLATSTTAASSSRLGSNVNASVALKNSGLLTAVTTSEASGTSGTFRINGTSVSVDYDTDSLNDVIGRINSTVSGVTASLVDATGAASPTGNFVKLSSSSAISIGAGADTSNFLKAVGLQAAQAKAASTTGGTVATGALATGELHINGVIVSTRATAAGNTAAQNAASLAADINNTANTGVLATANSDGTLTLSSKTRGVGASISITQATADSGLSTGTTTQATDEYVSALGIGGTSTSAALGSSRLATAITGLDGDGNGSFKVNGVSVSYNQNESLDAVLTRINSSNAGVVAMYDSALDRVSFSAKTTGAVAISFEDVTGNLLAAVGATSATQNLGKNALYRVSSVNGGAQQSSVSNTITNAVPGVELRLKQVSAAAINVSIDQNTAGAVSAVQSFVDGYNNIVTNLGDQTKVDPTGKDAGMLSDDTTLKTLAATMRSYLVTPSLGLTGTYTSLSDIGITFGSAGTAVGSANTLQLDSSKLTKALQNSPQTVFSLLSGYQSTTTLQAGGTGAVASLTGSATGLHTPGSYTVKTTAGGAISAQFLPTGGALGEEKFGSSITAGGTNADTIPGITFSLATPLVTGTHTVNVAVQQRGILVGFNDFLKTVTGGTGMLQTRADSAQKTYQSLDKQINDATDRMNQKKTSLQSRYAQLESLMSKLQSQSSSLAAQLNGLANSSSSK